MTPYKGIIRVSCKRKKGGCLKNLQNNVEPGCMDCEDSVSEILDLEDKVIYEYRSPEVKSGKRVKARGRKTEIRGSEKKPE
nr:hypothetical protein 2 [bacterium]